MVVVSAGLIFNASSLSDFRKGLSPRAVCIGVDSRVCSAPLADSAISLAWTEAEVKYGKALELAPQGGDVWSDIGRLFHGHRALKEAEACYRRALQIDPSMYRVQWLLGRIQHSLGNATAAREQWRNALDVMIKHGLSALGMVINMGTTGDDGYRQALARERDAFQLFCNQAMAKTTPERRLILTELPRALRKVRTLENGSDWLVHWMVERAEVGEADEGKSSYGTTWFDAWKAAVSKPSVSAAIRLREPQATALVVGSGLGEQCHFALALGFAHCVGYELLCKSMVTSARRIAEEHGLVGAMRFRCSDARETGVLGFASVVWMNDLLFSESVRRGLLDRFAQELIGGAVVVSMLPPPRQVWWSDTLSLVDSVDVPVSWAFRQRLYIMEKKFASHASVQ